jgi:hypothetical protein
MRTLFTLALCTSLTASAADDELNPEKVAKIQSEQDKANKEIAKKYGNRKPSEMNRDERREMIRDTAEAEKAVLEKNKVDAREYTRYNTKMSRDDRAATKVASDKIAADEKAAAEKAEAEKKAGPKEIQIQRGFSDNNPVVLEEKQPGAGEVVVEKGLPQDAMEDQQSATELGGGQGPAQGPPDQAPPAKGKGGRRPK